MAPRKDYYSVHKGREPGVYETWAECQRQTDQFSGQVLKGFGAGERAKHGRVPATTSKYYGVTGGCEAGVYASLDEAQSAMQGHEDATCQGFDTLIDAKAWLTNQGVDASMIKLFQSHFAQYPEFEPESNKPFDEEFKRLAQSQDWVPNSQQYHEERTLAIKQEIQNEYWEPVLKEEELSQLTSEERRRREEDWKIRGYQALLNEVNKEPRDSIEACVEILQSTLVNIVDLLDARRTGMKVEVFENFKDFRAYTIKPGKRIHLATAKKDAFLSTLLQNLRNAKGPRLHRTLPSTVHSRVVRDLYGRREKKNVSNTVVRVRNARVRKSGRRGNRVSK